MPFAFTAFPVKKCNTGASADTPVLLYIKIIFPLKMAKAKRRPFKIVPPALSIASQEISAAFKRHICDMQFNVVAVALKS